MKEFEYVIKDEIGIHARPAGVLVKAAKEFSSRIIVEKGEEKADMRKMIQLMQLGAKCGDTIRVLIDGEDEELAAEEIGKKISENL
ncbi:MAG: HPr family phosphocarrier protein [Bacillota bacterium]|uniref:Phosphocarrier protein n=1 Tax=[Clostridium] aminophilum TaxID=1526 RepID=A0A1I6IBQ4_9FIRM|nr:HPr family phosphocarrier protein [[Clostridium] aminophilum]MCR4629902.1 HPr family phosphocarrier protein [Clostridium sp.]MDT3843022.1 HPr family phosphocarrier protein [Bacillota bacterium]SFR64177.1 phosphocarrier protein [[Clostridium] aminophilum]